MVLTSTVQACTGIEDLGIAIMHLEEANWVLVVSKQKVGSSDLIAFIYKDYPPKNHNFFPIELFEKCSPFTILTYSGSH